MIRSTLSRLAVVALTIALGAFGCATGDEAETTAPQTEPTVQTAAEMDSGEILHVLETINQSEISQARLALRRSQNPDVQQIAQVLIQDHQALSERIQNVADTTGVVLTDNELSQEVADKMSGIEEELADLSGDEFDQAFLNRQVEVHEFVLETAQEDLMPQAEEAQVRQVISDASANMEENLVVARQSLQEAQDEAIGGGPEEDQEQMEEDVDEMEEDVDEMEEDRQDMYEEDQWE